MFSVDQTREKILNTGDLKVGDVIFNVRNFDGRFAGHVSIVVQPHADPKQVRVIHSTNNKQLSSFCITKLNPHTRVLEFKNHYEVLRCQDQILMEKVLKIAKKWVQYELPFDDDNAKQVENEENEYFADVLYRYYLLRQEYASQQKLKALQQPGDERKDDSEEFETRLSALSTKVDQRIQQKLLELRKAFQVPKHQRKLAEFHANRNGAPFLKPLKFLLDPEAKQNSFFCSSSILLSFQVALLPDVDRVKDSDIEVLPIEFQIPMSLCTPTMLFNALLKTGNFVRCGVLENDYILNREDNAKLNQERDAQIDQMDKMTTQYREMLGKKLHIAEMCEPHLGGDEAQNRLLQRSLTQYFHHCLTKRTALGADSQLDRKGLMSIPPRLV